MCDLVVDEQNINVQTDDSEQPLVIKHYCTKLREKNKVIAFMVHSCFSLTTRVIFRNFWGSKLPKR